jgi:hypothetical protein
MTEQASLTEQIIRPSVEEIHASIPHKGVQRGPGASNRDDVSCVHGGASRPDEGRVEQMNPSLKRGIKQAQTFVCSRRPC